MLKLKKVFSILLVAIMCATMLPTAPLTVAAAGDGDYKGNFEVTIQSKANQKYLTLSGAAGDATNPVKFTGEENETGTTMRMAYYNNNGVLNINVRSAETNLAMAEFYAIDALNGVGVYHYSGAGYGGWESFGLVPNGDGTVSFTSNRNAGKFLTVNATTGVLTVNQAAVAPSNNEKFVISTTATPPAVEDSSVRFENVGDTYAKILWDALPADAVFSGYQVMRSTTADGTYEAVGTETAETEFVDSGLAKSTTYFYKIRTVNGDSPYNDTNAASVSTAADAPPSGKVTDITAEATAGGTKISWPEVEGATGYDIARATGKYATFTTVATAVSETSYVDADTLTATASKFSYYKVRPINSGGPGDWGAAMSLENAMFGEYMHFFSPDDADGYVNYEIEDVFGQQREIEFEPSRHAIYFKPGSYANLNTIRVGYYTHIGGLGKVPTDVELSNIETPARTTVGNGGRDNTVTFWRSAENITVLGSKSTMYNGNNFVWGVSQAAPLRRAYSKAPNISYQWWWDGTASGGFTADTKIDGGIVYMGQQQWYTRNSTLTTTPNTATAGWNTFYQGTAGVPATNWASKTPPADGWSYVTNIEDTPIIREKPFLYLDEENDAYKVFVPALREDAVGVSWSETDMGEGTSLDVANDFYIAKEGDSSAVINAALEEGKHLFFTPGIYELDDPIRIKNPNTVVLGTGYATLIPSKANGRSAMIVDDVDGVTVAGLLFDALYSSDFLLQVGPRNSSANHSANPTLIADVFIRVGGFVEEDTHVDFAIQVNSNNVIGDHFWIWRADHGKGVGWNRNTSRNGMIVNGDDVTFYGLFNEHFQEYSTLWNGERGRTYFYQNETPYDPLAQSDYMSHNGTVKGWAQYKVANHVDDHYAVGLGIYDVFINTQGALMEIENAIEVPNKPGVTIENACFICISGINNNPTGMGTRTMINGAGTASLPLPIGGRTHFLKYNNGILYLNDGVEIPGTQPADEIADFTKANEVLDAVANLDQSDYTAEVWAEIQELKTELEALVAEGSSAMQADIDALVNQLDRVKGQTEDPGDDPAAVAKAKEDLAKEITAGSGLKAADYTAASWKKYSDALAVAVALQNSANPSKADLDKALSDLKAAKAGLAKAPATKLAAPKSVKVSQAGAKKAKVTWAKVTGAVKYDVYRSTKAASGYKKVGTVTAASYTDKKATAGKTFYYKVVAVGKTAAANSVQSASAKVSIMKKAAITVKTPARGKIKVSWKRVSGATGYQVYVSTKKNSGYKKTATITKGKTKTRTIAKIGKKSLKKGTRYYVKVRPIKKVGNKTVVGTFSNPKRTQKVK